MSRTQRVPVGSYFTVALLLVILASPGLAVAQDEASDEAAPIAPQKKWLWSITPYVWATSVSENITFKGADVGGGDTSFKDLADLTDFALQAHFEGVQDRWGVFADINYASLSDSQTGDLEVLRFDVNIKETLGELGAIYRPGGRDGRFDVLAGIRSFWVTENYSLGIGDVPPLERGIKESYLDALIGARYRVPLGQRWGFSLRGDASFGGTDSIWTLGGQAGWRFGAQNNSALFVGYRYRSFSYTKADVLDVKKTLSGFGFGVKIGF